jgi:hypothetical protein
MKRWLTYLAITLLVLGLLDYYYLSKWTGPLNSILQREKTQRGASASKDQQASEEILALRQRHHLRPLTERENGTPLRDVAHGTYGFTNCDGQTVHATRTNSSVEIQKHLDGIVYYVGYTSEDHVEKYFSRQKNFHSPLSLERRGKASLVFEIPVDFVSKCTMSSAGETPLYDLFVAAIPELQS